MKYVGSKNRIAKDVAPIIQSYIDDMSEWCNGYWEPFVGGANMIDKIYCIDKYGSDAHKYLIALLRHVKQTIDDVPDTIYRDTTKYATDDFPYDEFYDWCRQLAKHNVVLVSEYWMPDDFECIWQGKLKCTLDNASRTDKSEKLYRCIAND